jgi:class 3 adenylate cyclase/CHASE2 domain-containing sensor protein
VARSTTITGLVCILLIGVVVTTFRVGATWDMKLLDAQFRVLRTHFPRPAPEVVLVGIDEATVAQFPEPMTLWHPHLARFLQAMARARPAAVGFDLVLPDRSFEAIAPGYDKALLKGIIGARREFPLVLALTVDAAGKPRQIHPPFVAAAGAGATGYALLPVDRDGVVRRFDENLGEGGSPVPTLAGQMARRIGIEPRAGFIDFARGAAFDYLPLQTVLAWAESGDARLQQAFRDKPVLLGSVLQFVDRQRMPVNLTAWDTGADDAPGVMLHAQALRTMAGGGAIANVSSAIPVLLAVAAALLWLWSLRLVAALFVLFAVVAACVAGSTALLAHGSWLPVSGVMFTSLLALGGRYGVDTTFKLRERRKLRHAFSGYVSPSVMDEILAGQLSPGLGGVNKFVCVMFSDIRGYTTRSEGMAPEAVIAFLNRYFEQVVQLIHARGGSVVSFMGDGIMAMFGAPKPLANPCAEAFAAACEMLDYVRHFNADSRAAGEKPIEIGIGLHGGEAVVGHVGATSRHDFTAIGDVTNVASRLEGLTKEVGYRLVCSRVVAEQLPRADAVIPLGLQSIKGHSPVEACGYDKV